MQHPVHAGTAGVRLGQSLLGLHAPSPFHVDLLQILDDLEACLVSSFVLNHQVVHGALFVLELDHLGQQLLAIRIYLHKFP